MFAAESLRILADAAAARADAGQSLSATEVTAWLDDWARAHGHPVFDPATMAPDVDRDAMTNRLDSPTIAECACRDTR